MKIIEVCCNSPNIMGLEPGDKESKSFVVTGVPI